MLRDSLRRHLRFDGCFWYNFLSALKDEADAAENRESKQTINKDRY